jgi:acylphosphatase
MDSSRTAAEILVEGRVQGVGYRLYARQRAAALGLAGYAMNLRDGRVCVHAEGARELIEDLVRALEQGPPVARVERLTVRWLPPTNRAGGFTIRAGDVET